MGGGYASGCIPGMACMPDLAAAAAAAAAASSASLSRFFLNLVSVMGRKKVQLNPYCLQWAQVRPPLPLFGSPGGGEPSSITSHLIFFRLQESHARAVLSLLVPALLEAVPFDVDVEL